MAVKIKEKVTADGKKFQKMLEDLNKLEQGNMKVTVVGKLLVKIICGRNHTMYWLSIRLY